MKGVTIIIPTKNSGDYLENCLKSIENLNYPKKNLEVIVVDGYSKDNTCKIAEKYGCKIVYENVGTRAGACNLAIADVSNEYVAFTDADCVVPKDWLENLVKHFEDVYVASVGGPNLTPEDDTEFAKCAGEVLEFLSKPGARYGFNADTVQETFHNPSCNVAYVRRVLEEVGGFDEALVTCEDEELDYRIRDRGFKIIYTSDARVFHYRRPTYKRFGTQAYKYAIGRAQAVKLHRRMGKWFHFVPSILTAFILLLLISSIFSLAAFWVLLSSLAVGGFGVFFMSMVLAMRRDKIETLPVFFGLILLWFFGFSAGLFRGFLKRHSNQEGRGVIH